MKKKNLITVGAVLVTVIAYLFLSLACASSPKAPTNTYEQDMATLLRRFEEIEDIEELPTSSFLTKGEAPRIIPSTMKSVASEKELLQKTTQMANQYFYRIVGSLDSKKGTPVTGSFSGDVAALCWELGLGIAVWDVTAETSQYHSGYFVGTTWVEGWTSYNRDYKAYFLVPIPRSDRDAWMLGLNVKDLDYEDRERLSRNTGVLITNVYDNTPAFTANLRPDYVITAVNGKTVSTMEDWLRETEGLKAGAAVKLTTAHYGHNEYFSETVVARAIPPEEPKKSAEIKRPEIGTNADMIFIAAGTFFMGDESGQNDEKPVHEVEVDAFYMCNHEVTQEEWIKVMGTNPSYCVGANFDEKYQPVERVNWKNAIDYCNKRSESEGLTKCYTTSGDGGITCNFSANGYRLPTEAEWEYVARGGNKGKDKTYSGSTNIDTVAWYNGNTGFPQPVMTKSPNKLGIYDLSGNVWELCWDRYNTEYYAKSPKSNPRGAMSSSVSNAYIVRGGSAYNNAATATVFNRGYVVRTDFYYSTGLRVVRSDLTEAEIAQRKTTSANNANASGGTASRTVDAANVPTSGSVKERLEAIGNAQ